MRGHPGLKGGPIYLDYNATTPIDPQVAEAMWPYLSQHFGNPSSTHIYGRQAHLAVAQARQEVSALLESIPELASSTGSACHEGLTDPSPVLSAMGLERNRAQGALRLTLGRWTDEQQVEMSANLLVQAIWQTPFYQEHH